MKTYRIIVWVRVSVDEINEDYIFANREHAEDELEHLHLLQPENKYEIEEIEEIEE